MQIGGKLRLAKDADDVQAMMSNVKIAGTGWTGSSSFTKERNDVTTPVVRPTAPSSSPQVTLHLSRMAKNARLPNNRSPAALAEKTTISSAFHFIMRHT